MLREKKIQPSEEQLKHLEKYIEQYCSEADRKCKEIDPMKAVDQVIDEMTEEQFINFTKPLIEDVTKRIKKSKQKKKKKVKQKKKEQEKKTEKEEQEIMEEAVTVEGESGEKIPA